MAASLLQYFRGLDKHTKDLLADLESLLMLSFATLSIAHDKCNTERLSAEHIVACLEASGVAVKRNSISRSLARASDRVSVSTGLDGERLYRLMTKGEREVSPLLGGGALTVLRVDGQTPRTARSRLGELLGELKGVVRICDPYYGLRTLDSLDHIRASCPIRFLTVRTNESGRKLTGALKDFKRERPKVEFRVASAPSELHDRYILTSAQLLLIGHGLKDIGGRESFVIRLDQRLATGLIKQTREAFDQRWKQGSVI